ncbi:hypothetical protein ALP91_101155 [Pseudomonas savastanoi pv. glycinea]|nr:hypothetical protein ALP91_101155 [Pseudomonas savastanoi pv. glycinea]
MRVADLGGQFLHITLSVEYPVEIKTALFGFGIFQLLVIILYVLAERGGLEEVHRRARDGRQFAGRDQLVVDRCVVRSVQGGDLFEYITAACTRQVEIAMVGQVQHCRLVSGGAVVNLQLVFLIQAVSDFSFQCARKAHLAIRRHVGQLHAGRITGLGFFCLPESFVKTLSAAVQGIGLVVERDLVGLAIQAELAACQAVAESADGRAEINRAVVLVALNIVEAQDDVLDLSGLVRHQQRLQRRAVGDDAGLHAVTVAQGEFLDGSAVGQLAESAVLAGECRGLCSQGADHQGQSKGAEESMCFHLICLLLLLLVRLFDRIKADAWIYSL